MPELPEIEIVKRSLFKKINKAKIVNVKINNKNLRYKIPRTFSKKLINEKILKISRRSKYLIFHLRMTGNLYYSKNISENKKHLRCYFTFSDNSYLLFEDIRKFGGFYYYKNLKPLNDKLGIDPFDSNFTFNWFKKNISNKKSTIKSLLLNQKFILPKIWILLELICMKHHRL